MPSFVRERWGGMHFGLAFFGVVGVGEGREIDASRADDDDHEEWLRPAGLIKRINWSLGLLPA